MARDLKSTHLSGREIFAALIIISIQASSLAFNGTGAPATALTAAYPLPNRAVPVCSWKDPGKRPEQNSLDQSPQQSRPRRVSPADPATQPSPAPGRDSAGKSKRPADPRPDTANPKTHYGDRQKGTGPSYTVQVGAFLGIENARRLAQSLDKNGYSAQVVTRNDSHRKKWHCVRVGSYPDQEQARKTAAEIEGKLKLKAIVRPSASL